MRASFDNLSPDADRDLSRLHAKKIAEALGSKVQRERGIVIGEPMCDYKVPCHLDEFWCKAKVSEVTIIFESNHKRNGSGLLPFCFTITPWRNIATDTEVMAAAPIIGRSVFRQHWMEEQPILECLRSPQVKPVLSEVLKEDVTFLFCCGAQLMAEFDSSESAVSVRRIKNLQSLQLALHDFARR
jgi:hypothetical protein